MISRVTVARTNAMTLMELLVATAIGSVLAAVIFTLTSFGQHSFAIMANDSDLDAKNRNAMDILSRELRQATRVTGMTSNSLGKSLTLTNADQGIALSVQWNAKKRTLTLNQTGETNLVLLTACDRWDFNLYNRAVNVSATDVAFTPAASLADCKLIGMSWSCSTNAGRANSVSAQTTQIALRNKLN